MITFYIQIVADYINFDQIKRFPLYVKNHKKYDYSDSPLMWSLWVRLETGNNNQMSTKTNCCNL